MNCPYCQQEMKDGFLKSSHAIYWGEDKSLGILSTDLQLTKSGFKGILAGYSVDSHYCSHCKKIVVSLEDA